MKSFIFLQILLILTPALTLRHKAQDPITSPSSEGLSFSKLDTESSPNSRQGHSSAVYGSDIIVFGGCDLKGTCYNDILEFDTR